MQINYRYLLNRQIIIICNDVHHTTEFSPVYTQELKIYKNIRNTLEFKIINSDQKPISLDNYTVNFRAFNFANKLVLSKECTNSTSLKGITILHIEEHELLNFKKEYLKFNIFLTDANNEKKLTYSDAQFNNNGTMIVDDYIFPGPLESHVVKTFVQENDYWISEAIVAEPALNGNEALHSLAIYTNNYSGQIDVQGTLDNSSITTLWAVLDTLTLNGTETEPILINLTGVFNFLRIKTYQQPLDTITKILVRN